MKSQEVKLEHQSLRLYDYETVVGGIAEKEYPKQFTLSRKASIKNQKPKKGGEILCCAGCAAATVLEYIFGIAMSESFLYAVHRSHNTPGMYLSRLMEGLAKVGAVPLADFGVLLEVPEIINLVNSQPELLEKAKKYKITGYAKINYANAERKDLAIKDALSRADVALIASSPDYFGGCHAFALDGWDDEKNKYKLQDSYGRDSGDNGYKEIPKDEVGEVYAVFVEELEIPFEDVPRDSWYYKDIRNLFFAGLINGKTETTFDPDGGITRAENAAMMSRLLNMIDERFIRLYDILNKEFD